MKPYQTITKRGTLWIHEHFATAEEAEREGYHFFFEDESNGPIYSVQMDDEGLYFHYARITDLPPSLEHKKDIHIQRIKRICDVMPVTDITMEMGNFDTQVLKALEEGRPLPQGKDYQQGESYGIATLREAVFSRDNYTCQCCGRSIKDHAILHAHHVKYRSQGGTDRIGNVVTVCEKCHTSANHQPGGKLWNWKPKIKSFKGATYMTAVRWKLYHEVKALFPDKEIHITYGAVQKNAGGSWR